MISAIASTASVTMMITSASQFGSTPSRAAPQMLPAGKRAAAMPV